MLSASSSSLPSTSSRIASTALRSASLSFMVATVRSSPSNSLMANQRAVAGDTRLPRMPSIFSMASSTCASKGIFGSAGLPAFAACTAVSMSSAMPCPLSAVVSTTGQPNCFDKPATSILSPFFFTRSIMLSATTTGTPRSRICVVRYRLRSRFVASTRFTTTSGPPSNR